MKNLLLVDGDAVAWASFHALPSLSSDEQDTAVVFGFLNTLMYIQEQKQAQAIAFAWDSRKSKRKKIFPEYKIGREKKREEYTPAEKVLHEKRRNQFMLLRTSVLPQLGFANIFWHTGYEGDDIIASIVQDYSPTHKITIVARDNDLYQVLNPNTEIFDWISRKTINEERLFKDYGVTPAEWREVKAIAGCNGDDVPGIPGIGVGYASKYVLGTLKSSAKKYRDIVSSPETIEFTRKLTTLPFEGVKQCKLEKDNCTVAKFMALAKQYQFKSYAARQHDWREYFCERTQNIR